MQAVKQLHRRLPIASVSEKPTPAVLPCNAVQTSVKAVAVRTLPFRCADVGSSRNPAESYISRNAPELLHRATELSGKSSKGEIVPLDIAPGTLPVDLFLRNVISSVPVALVPSNDGIIRMKNPKMIQTELRAGTTQYQSITEVTVFGKGGILCFSSDQLCVRDLLKCSVFATNPQQHQQQQQQQHAGRPSGKLSNVPRKLWRSRAKSQSRVSTLSVCSWSPEGCCRWRSRTGGRLTLRPTTLVALTETEAMGFRPLAVNRLQSIGIGCKVDIPREDSTEASAKLRRRPALLRKKAITTSFFESRKESADIPCGQVFGVGLQQVVQSDRQRFPDSTLAQPAPWSPWDLGPDVAAADALSRRSDNASESSLSSLADFSSRKLQKGTASPFAYSKKPRVSRFYVERPVASAFLNTVHRLLLMGVFFSRSVVALAVGLRRGKQITFVKWHRARAKKTDRLAALLPARALKRGVLAVLRSPKPFLVEKNDD
ncbi:hypothetical protein HPB51_002397 [Rhipicephalus microplus]|uniref:Uncharacterized protein n=1 Tax=Rhipicephalus microplus TaxID=6941 RepID=A0A9J6DS16_RHIMP|nr:hypothetical protein HPB51_002397 [Rhipicephalus microplus]